MNPIPQHVAIIMDGNGRFATSQGLSRPEGHVFGQKAVQPVVEHCANLGVKALTLFALSLENLSRPLLEVKKLFGIFSASIDQYLDYMCEHNIQFVIVGDFSKLPVLLVRKFRKAMQRTQDNTGLVLSLAINYTGRWDILQAAKKMYADLGGDKKAFSTATEADFSRYLSFAHLPEPDLFIRTSGEHRISNFLLWQLAYTELYFTEVMWPDFTIAELDKAMLAFSQRERRYGLTSAQLIQE